MRRITRFPRQPDAAILTSLRSARPPAPAVGPDTAAQQRDRAAQARDAAALDRELTVLAALEQHGHLSPRRTRRASTPGRPARRGEFEQLAAKGDWPGIVQMLVSAAAAERECAARDRQLAAEDRELAARDRSRAGLDELSGALARHVGLDHLATELNRAGRTGSSVVVAALDVAGLQAVNRAFGAQAGDNILSALGRLLRQRLRSYDAIVRTGDGEFACIFVDTAVPAVARRLRQLRGELLQLTPPITVRVGLGSRQPTDTAATLLARAESALHTVRHGQQHVPM